MSTRWYKFPHFEPPLETPLIVRDWTDPAWITQCVYLGQPSNNFAASNGWQFPSCIVFAWGVDPAGGVVKPRPELRNSVYRDVIHYPPAVNQLCWIRNPLLCGAPIKATWLDGLPPGAFYPVELPLLAIPWWAIADWRPAG